MELTSGYPGQSGPMPIKMMAMSDVDNSHRRNSNRHPPVSATFSTGHGSGYGSNGKLYLILQHFFSSLSFSYCPSNNHLILGW